jgi:hypothetical protein
MLLGNPPVVQLVQNVCKTVKPAPALLSLKMVPALAELGPPELFTP